MSLFVFWSSVHCSEQCVFLQKGISFHQVMSNLLCLDVDTCWSRPLRGGGGLVAVMDGLIAMQEHKLIGYGETTAQSNGAVAFLTVV